jgi:hypothetical protein
VPPDSPSRLFDSRRLRADRGAKATPQAASEILDVLGRACGVTNRMSTGCNEITNTLNYWYDKERFF